MIFELPAHPLLQKDIDHAEQRLGLNLPADLSEHYLRVNGGSPLPNCLVRDGEYYKINDMLSLVYEGVSGTIEEAYIDLVSRNVLPRRMLPFAVDAGGDLFVYELTTGYIWMFDSEHSSNAETGFIHLADSFDEFMSNLVIDEDP